MTMAAWMEAAFTGGLTAQVCCLRVGTHPAMSLVSSNEPCELSQWLAKMTAQ